MSSVAIGLALALTASLALNGSYVIQHVGAAGAPPVDARRPLVTMAGLFRSRAWLAGAALGMTGWAVHVAALAHAPLSLVQAFVAGGLALMAPVASKALGSPLTRAEWIGVAMAIGAMALLCVGLGSPGAHGHVRVLPSIAFLGGCGAAAAALARTHRIARPQALGIAGGLLYGAADVAIKALTGSTLISPWLLVAAAATAAAFFAFQRGLQTGSAVPVIVLMTSGTTVVSLLGGLIVFGDPLGRSPGLVALHLSAFVLVTVAAAALAPVASGGRRL